ncbi:probable 2' cyclic ADP-D-ribose synthase BdTIR [Cryptomeria japonica]|uniref:probable 2' cyclic ADP-D-ribose synthase BdTIR n=1 Tax=Cryptomeria japonica TaxID=3369 RepID=UPI0027DA1A48|nr:probable 2' cyclic ADP-D-ribose synthase BdTIR [Cryptomeria japonica]
MASFSSPHQQNKKLHAFSGIESVRKRRKVEESSRLFDVFINHRGPDVKHTLAIQLYDSLKNLGIRTFLDAEEKELGDSFISTIETAIRSASVQIAIFSRGYAESPWCLA